MSRFGSSEPFYRAIEQHEHDERIARIVAADAERHRWMMMLIAAQPLRPPIIDRDPGDEDPGSGR